MEFRPDMKKYRRLLSASIIEFLALIILLVSVASMVFGIANGSPILGLSGIYVGIVGIILSAFLFIISNIAEDIHWQSYIKEYYGEETVYYHTQSLKRLQSIEGMLQQHFYPQHQQTSVPQNPTNQYAPQQRPQSGVREQYQPERRQRRYTEEDVASNPFEPREEVFDYRAQYRRPRSLSEEESRDKEE